MCRALSPPHTSTEPTPDRSQFVASLRHPGIPSQPVHQRRDAPAHSAFCALLIARSPAPHISSCSVHSCAFSQLARRAAAQPLAWSSSPTGLAQDPPLPRPTPLCASARRCALPARPPSVRAGRLCCGRIGRRSCAPRAAIRPSLCPRGSLQAHLARGRRDLSGSAGFVGGWRVCGARERRVRVAHVPG